MEHPNNNGVTGGHHTNTHHHHTQYHHHTTTLAEVKPPPHIPSSTSFDNASGQLLLNTDNGNNMSLMDQTQCEFESGYVAAALLMSASIEEREEILNIGRVFSQSSPGARAKFAQLVESIRDDTLLLKALKFIGASTKLEQQPGMPLAPPTLVLQPTVTPPMPPPTVVSVTTLPIHSQQQNFVGETFSVNSNGSNSVNAPKLDAISLNGVFSLPFVASSGQPSLSLPSQPFDPTLNMATPHFQQQPPVTPPEPAIPVMNMNIRPPLNRGPPPAKRRKRSRSIPSILSLLPCEGGSLKPLYEMLKTHGIDSVTTRELTAISAHFGIPIRGNKDQRAHRVEVFLDEWEKTFYSDGDSDFTYLFTKDRIDSCRDRILGIINKTWKIKVAINPHLDSDREDGEGDPMNVTVSARTLEELNAVVGMSHPGGNPEHNPFSLVSSMPPHHHH
jgi:hypothetical protein